MSIELDSSPIRRPLPDVGTLTGQLVSHFIDSVSTRNTLLGDAISGDVTTMTTKCREVGDRVIAGRDVSHELSWFSAAAASWAREGVPIDTMLLAFYEALQLSLDVLCAPEAAHDRDALVDGLRTAMAISNLMSTTMIRAYFREHRGVVGEHRTAARALASALLAGRATTTIARDCGIGIAENYRVIALSIPQDAEDHRPPLDKPMAARRRLRRVRAALAHHREDALAMLSIEGGTVLVPGEDPDDTRLDILIEELSRAARLDISATSITTTTDKIPDAAQRAHELLDVIGRLGYTPRLYRFEDLALEYQLTRPGPGLTRLGQMLEPLDAHPDLYETLRVLVANDMNRQRTARLLHIHANTVLYRIRRIQTLTGLDATHTAGLWQLKSAVIARTFALSTSSHQRLAEGAATAPVTHVRLER
ncbi:PucR family transcriptional regulator [Nocardia sp. NPDC058633]|uniref:PucR family transcriptional regulator n=1 Tax=Nocardia sp. NPDC058633 TaxID=3346568 RepID=UPI00365548EC